MTSNARPSALRRQPTRRRTSTLPLAMAAVLALLGSAPTFAQSWSAAKSSDLDTWIRQAMVTADVPGATVAVVQNGQVVFQAAYGVRDRTSRMPVRLSTQFPLASVSKPITTTMMAAIADTGLFSWDTTAVSLYPNFRVADPQASARMTMRNLVCQCTGVLRRDFDLIYRATALQPTDVLAQLAGYGADTPFGQRFVYSNHTVAAGGWIAAAAASGISADLKGSYAQQLQSRVLDPVGMGATTVDLAAVVSRGDFAASHPYDLNWQTQSQGSSSEQQLSAIVPAAGLWSTSGDMARFVIMQLQRGVSPSGVRVASAANLTETWKPQVNIAPGFDYGLGMFIASVNGRRWLLHDGNGLGATSSMTFLPDQGVGVIVLSNRGFSAFPGYVRARAIRTLFNESGDDLLPALTQEVSNVLANLVSVQLNTSAVTAAEAGALAGQWRHPVLGSVNMIADSPYVGYSATAFANRLVKYVANGQTAYLMRDGLLLGSALTPPTGNTVTVYHGDGSPESTYTLAR